MYVPKKQVTSNTQERALHIALTGKLLAQGKALNPETVSDTIAGDGTHETMTNDMDRTLEKRSERRITYETSVSSTISTSASGQALSHVS